MTVLTRALRRPSLHGATRLCAKTPSVPRTSSRTALAESLILYRKVLWGPRSALRYGGDDASRSAQH